MNAEKLEELYLYYNNPKNWRKPSLSQVAKFLGVKSKRTAKRWINKLKTQNEKL